MASDDRHGTASAPIACQSPRLICRLRTMRNVDLTISDCSIRFRDGETYSSDLHSHDDLQITIPLEHSSFEISWAQEDGTYEQKMLGAGSICIIPPLLEHQLSWINKAHFINLQIGTKQVQSLLSDLYEIEELVLLEQIGVRDSLLQNLGTDIEQMILAHGDKAEE